MTVTLKKDFTKEQMALADNLLAQLMEGSEELSEFSAVEVYGIKESDGIESILFEIGYSNPESESNGETIYNLY